MNIEFKVDPLGKYSEHSHERIIESCGMLPIWAMDPTLFHMPLKEAMDKAYRFGLFEMTQGKNQSTIDDDGMHHYPGDRDLAPLVTIKRGDEIMHQYESAIVCFIDKDGTKFLTRMD